MKVGEMIVVLEKLNPEDEIEIYIHEAQKTIVDNGIDLNGCSYFLIEPTIVDKDNGWDGLITIEPGKVVGC